MADPDADLSELMIYGFYFVWVIGQLNWGGTPSVAGAERRIRYRR
jgi:hypothetical protein